MSRSGVGHIWETPLESGLGAGYAWLSREKAERPDMFGLRAGHVWSESLESS
jgi:hypothetical protein